MIKMTNHTEVEVSELPMCDICNHPRAALYDCNLGQGWGNVCQEHFETLGCQLGLGKGQKLVVLN